MPRMIPDSIRKISATVSFTDEMLFDLRASYNPEYMRRHTETIVPPTPEDWNLYRKAVRGMKDLQAYEGTDWGSPESEPEVEPPRATRKIEYLETHEEWMARCYELRKAEAGGA